MLNAKLLPAFIIHVRHTVTHEFKLIFIQQTVKCQQSLTHTLSLELDMGSCPAFAFITVISFFRQLIDRWSQCV